MQKGYRFPRSECRFCGEIIADNHYIHHLRKEHPVVDGKSTYAALPNEKPLPVRKPKKQKIPRRAFFKASVHHTRHSRPRRLPAHCILEGLFAVKISGLQIAAWFGVSSEAVYHALHHGSKTWENLWIETQIVQHLPPTNGRLLNDDLKSRVAALPPQSVLDTWRRQGRSPAEMARLCERLGVEA